MNNSLAGGLSSDERRTVRDAAKRIDLCTGAPARGRGNLRCTSTALGMEE